MPHEFTAVPAARSSDKAFRVKQALVIGGVLFGAALGPLALFVSVNSKVNVPALQQSITQDIRSTGTTPDALLAAAELVANAWVAGKALDIPHLSNVELATGILNVTDLKRIGFTPLELSSVGLSPQRYQSAWDVVFRALRQDGSSVFISVPMAITVPQVVTLSSGSQITVPGTSVLRAAPSLRPFIYPSDPEQLGQGDVLVPNGWEPVEIADTSPVVQLAQRWSEAYLQDSLASTNAKKLDPAADKDQDGLDDVLAPPPSALQERIQDHPELPAYRGIGGLKASPTALKILSGPYKPTAANTAHAGQLLVTVSFGALGSDQTAPTLTHVTMTMDLLVKAESYTVLAWGPSGSGASLTSHQNHTAYLAWNPPALGQQ